MSGSTEPAKPRVRVQAGSSRNVAGFFGDPARAAAVFRTRDNVTQDAFQNFYSNTGYGTNNVSSGGMYGFDPLSRNRMMLEWMYRGSWLVRKIVDCPAQDMTREGLQIESDMAPDQIDLMTQYWSALEIWGRICSALKWSRLYGGCLAAIMVAGQDPSTPLRLNTIGRGQFQGLLVLDRWMVIPGWNLVTQFGTDFGHPQYYDVVADARSVPRMRLHHSRCIRFDGIELPYWQRNTENEWGLSIIEPLWDRMIAFDSVTQGAAQLVYKAHLRILKLPQYRELLASGGPLLSAVFRQLELIRIMQTNEGLTVLDGDDDFQAQQYTFSGLSDMMVQFSQQVSGAADVPMTRLFGQSPAGMNATGESDLRNYYDGLRADQMGRLHRPVKLLLDISYRSLYGMPLPHGFNFSFKPLWQLADDQKAAIASQYSTATEGLFQAGVFSRAAAMKEIRQQSRITGFGSNITDEEIQAAEEEPPPSVQAQQEQEMQEAQMQQGQQGGAQQQLEGPHQGPEEGQGVVGETEQPEEDQVFPGGELGETHLGEEPTGSSTNVAARYGKLLERAKLFAAGRHTREIARHERRGRSIARNFLRRVGMRDRASIIDVWGIPVIIETAKGETRRGYGWSVNMPAHYGYISNTSSTEGPREQFDAFIGPNLESRKVYVIEQHDPATGKFDEHKAMLAFDSRDEAIATYCSAFSDGRGKDRIGNIREMEVDALKDYLARYWRYGKGEGDGIA